MARKQKSLRQLAKELGVSHSYLSQIRHGKRPASAKVVSKMVSNQESNVLCYNSDTLAEVAKQADATDLKFLSPKQLVSNFINSRRQGLSARTLDFYKGYLDRAKEVARIGVTGQEIRAFLDNLGCSNGGKHAYYRALRCFFHWLYSPKSELGLKPQDNPMSLVDAPRVEKRILPSLTPEQINYLIDQADCIRDKALISLFADSGLRLKELGDIKVNNIDWSNRLIKVRCKGNKDGLAVFGFRTEALLKEWLKQYNATDGRLWDITPRQIAGILERFRAKTGLPCNAHTFRRTFATVLAKRGVDSLHIMRLGRWESIQMVERYTRSVKFEDSLRLYREILSD